MNLDVEQALFDACVAADADQREALLAALRRRSACGTVCDVCSPSHDAWRHRHSMPDWNRFRRLRCRGASDPTRSSRRLGEGAFGEVFLCANSTRSHVMSRSRSCGRALATRARSSPASPTSASCSRPCSTRPSHMSSTPGTLGRRTPVLRDGRHPRDRRSAHYSDARSLADRPAAGAVLGALPGRAARTRGRNRPPRPQARQRADRRARWTVPRCRRSSISASPRRRLPRARTPSRTRDSVTCSARRST